LTSAHGGSQDPVVDPGTFKWGTRKKQLELYHTIGYGQPANSNTLFYET